MDINLERNLDQNISIDIIHINEEEAPPEANIEAAIQPSDDYQKILDSLFNDNFNVSNECDCVTCKTYIHPNLTIPLNHSFIYPMPFKCIQCNKGFMNEIDLKKHVAYLVTHIKETYFCFKCHVGFSTKLSYEMHVLSDLENEGACGLKEKKDNRQALAFKCKMCDDRFTSEKKLLLHSYSHWKCIYCGRKFKTFAGIHYHYKRKHSSSAAYLAVMYPDEFKNIKKKTIVLQAKKVKNTELVNECEDSEMKVQKNSVALINANDNGNVPKSTLELTEESSDLQNSKTKSSILQKEINQNQTHSEESVRKINDSKTGEEILDLQDNINAVRTIAASVCHDQCDKALIQQELEKLIKMGEDVLLEHLKKFLVHHNDEGIYKCFMCSKTFCTISSFKVHLFTHQEYISVFLQVK